MKQLLTSIAILVLSLSVRASGSSVRGGGDLCEDRIKSIREDIRSWILKEAHTGLTLPKGVSLDQYAKEMLNSIDRTKVQCVSSGDTGYPVEVAGTPKVCRFEKLDSVWKVTCDWAKFQAMSETDQYVLIHHEYAGLSNLENPSDGDSVYEISKQLSEYLEDTIVKKLSIRSIVTSEKTKFAILNSNFSRGSLPTANEIQGWWSGRCYDSKKQNTAVGSLFGAASFPLSVEGPLFEPTELNVGIFHHLDGSVDAISNPELFDHLFPISKSSWWYKELRTHEVMAKRGTGSWMGKSDKHNFVIRIRKFQKYIVLQKQTIKAFEPYKAGETFASCYFFIKLN